MKLKPTILLFSIFFFCCLTYAKMQQSNQATDKVAPSSKSLQDSIINQHLKHGAWKKEMYSQDWQKEIDKGLAKDSTIAYLWQQKAMPLFKQGKYELGMSYIDKAVQYNPTEWLEYRAFIKCIFAKTYQAAIKDFETCKAQYGNSYVMDHSYDFYIALSQLQLNQFAEAEALLFRETARQAKEQGEDWVHYLDLFYLGIAQYEQGKYQEAISTFDQTIKQYAQFAEAHYYKGKCVNRLGDKEAAKTLIQKAKEFGKQGYSINEDNAIYERYPYQIRWQYWN